MKTIRNFKMCKSIVIAFVIGFFASYKSFSQTTVNCPLLKDALISEKFPTTNYGTVSPLLSGKESTGELYNIYLKFDLSSIPYCATIDNATLSITDSWGTYPVGFQTVRVTSTWVENTITWNNKPNDLLPFIYASWSFFGPPGTTTNPFDSEVIDWIENGLPNYGILLYTSSWVVDGNIVGFYSKEGATPPSLSVTYFPPTLPDLIIQNPSANPISVEAGSIISLSCDIMNLGAYGGSSILRVYLSTDCNYSMDDVWLCTSTMGHLSTNASVTKSCSPTIPSGTSPGTYYILFYADKNNTVIECNETNNIGCVQITVTSPPPPPIANFIASSSSICEGDCINFTDLSTNNPTSWSWAFTNGTPSSSTSQNPINICYNTAGTYTVTLTATNSGGSDTETKTSYITVNSCPLDYLNVTSNSLTICSSSACQGSFIINSNVSWTITDDQNWLSVSPSSGSNTGTVFVTAASTNTSTSPRTATVTVSGTGVGVQNVIVTQDGTTGIAEIDFINNLSIHPNPNTGKFVIEMNITKVTDLEIRLLNVIGQVIYQEKLNRFVGEYQKAINVGVYAKGIYNLQLISDEGIINKKIMVE